MEERCHTYLDQECVVLCFPGDAPDGVELLLKAGDVLIPPPSSPGLSTCRKDKQRSVGEGQCQMMLSGQQKSALNGQRSAEATCQWSQHNSRWPAEVSDRQPEKSLVSGQQRKAATGHGQQSPLSVMVIGQQELVSGSVMNRRLVVIGQ